MSDELDGDGDGLGSFLHSGRAALARRFGIDTRALAAFRIALGLLVVTDLLLRARELTTFYTDTGVLPRAALAEVYPMLARYSLHAVSGETWFQALLFAVSGSLALALAAGYRTRAATVGVAALQASLYARNPYIMNGGDGLLVLALFLGVFLPLGERWSFDSLREGVPTPRTRAASLATATILLQLVIVYTVNAVLKQRSEAWSSGNAVRYVLELEQFSVGLGPYLTSYPELLVAINWLWVAMLALSGLLVLTTGRVRTLVVAGFVVAHLGMFATMRLGLFPFIVIALLLLYLPAPVWEWVDSRVAATGWPGAARSRDRLTPGSFPEVPRGLRRLGRMTATVVVAVVLVTSVLWPATALGFVPESNSNPASNVDGYTWTLFAPSTPTTTRWFVAPATLESGEQIDALHGTPVDWSRPPDAADRYPSTLWHRHLSDVRYASETERRYLAAHLCHRTRAKYGAEPTTVSVYVMEVPIDAVGGGDPQRTRLYTYDCTDSA